MFTISARSQLSTGAMTIEICLIIEIKVQKYLHYQGYYSEWRGLELHCVILRFSVRFMS